VLCFFRAKGRRNESLPSSYPMATRCACVSARPTAPHSRVQHWRRNRRFPTSRRATDDEPATLAPLAFDVVLYRDTNPTVGDVSTLGSHDLSDSSTSQSSWSLGAVIDVEPENGACLVTPLYEETETGVWLESHVRPRVTVSMRDLGKIVASDFAQRMSPDRVSNPHGEHAEDFWEIVSTETLPENVRRKDER